MRLALALIALAALALASLFLGVSEVSPLAVLGGTADQKAMLVIWASRVPRTIALMLAAAMMLEHLGEGEAAARIMAAMENTTARGIGTVPGRDKTDEITRGVLAALD